MGVNNMEDKVIKYRIGDLIKENPDMSCSHFIQIFLDDELDREDEQHILINLADEYSKADLEITDSIKDWDIMYYTVNLVHQKGGEGQGEYYVEVFEFTYADGTSEFISIEGRYNSWDDTDYDGYKPKIVKPVQKLVTVWV